MPKVAEIVIYDSVEEYQREFNERYVGKDFSLRGVPVTFVEKDFSHAFFEPKTQKDGGTRVFSERRAKRMRFIEIMLQELVSIEIAQENDERGNIAVFCDDLECVMYLRPRAEVGRLWLGTFIDFGKDHGKMRDKQKRKCSPISDEQLQTLSGLLVTGQTTPRNADGST